MINDPKIGNKKIGLIPSNERGIHLNANLRNEIIPPAKNPATNAPKNPDGVYANVIGLCKATSLDGEDGIIDQDYSLNAGRYVGVVIEDDGLTKEEFKEEMLSLNSEFTSLSAEARELEECIVNNLKELLGE